MQQAAFRLTIKNDCKQLKYRKTTLWQRSTYLTHVKNEKKKQYRKFLHKEVELPFNGKSSENLKIKQ